MKLVRTHPLTVFIVNLVDMSNTFIESVYSDSIKRIIVDMCLSFFGNLNIICRIVDITQHLGFSREARIIREEISMEKGIESTWVSEITIE